MKRNDRQLATTAQDVDLESDREDRIATQQITVRQSGRSSQPLAQYICEDCRSIDFNEIFNSKTISAKLRSGAYGVSVQDLSHVNSSSECKLCQVFERMKRPATRSAWCLAAHSVARKFSKYLPDSIILTVDPWHRTATNKTRAFLVPTYTAGGLSGLPVESLNHHTKFCQADETSDIPALQVIDCESRSICTLSKFSSEYVTLSYVWGPSTQGKNTGYSLPEILPATIEDAVTAVKSLGFRYLWVDRYCVPQDGSAEAQRLIELMGIIYENSVFTIIAAAGEDPNHGLPGISMPRKAQLPIQSGGSTMTVFSDYEVISSIQESKWNTRGWTYQEGLLSRRKLVFTNKCVSFQCGGMHCYENLSMPLKALHTQDLSRFREDITFPKPFPSRGVGRGSTSIEGRISEYARRDFTYDADVLRAFQGVLRRFETPKYLVKTILGIPVFDKSHFKPPRSRYTNRFLLGLTWEIRGSAHRRLNLPSWSWIAWKLDQKSHFWIWAARYTSQNNKPLLDVSFEVAGVTLEFDDNKVVPLDLGENEISLKIERRSLPTHVNLIGTMFDIVVSRDEHGVFTDKTWPTDGWESFPIPEFYQSPPSVGEKVTLTCLIICHSKTEMFLLLLFKQQGNEDYERVGSTTLKFSGKSDKEIPIFARLQETGYVQFRASLIRIA